MAPVSPVSDNGYESQPQGGCEAAVTAAKSDRQGETIAADARSERPVGIGYLPDAKAEMHCKQSRLTDEHEAQELFLEGSGMEAMEVTLDFEILDGKSEQIIFEELFPSEELL